MARLFVECGWTQEMIGKQMGHPQSWVARRLLLGRFLNYAHGQNSSSPPNSLTERRFRDAWSASGKRKKETEEERFGRVQIILREKPAELPRCSTVKKVRHMMSEQQFATKLAAIEHEYAKRREGGLGNDEQAAI